LELKKYTTTILLCFDTDLAGDVAARRGIEIADKAGFNIKVIDFTLVKRTAGDSQAVAFDKAKDPAELIKSDPKSWEKSCCRGDSDL